MNRFAIYLFFFLSFLVSISAFAQNGIVKTYFDDGSIESEISYINDILDGISRFYYPNGNIREEISLSYGKANGVNKKYFQNGLIREEKNLKDGILDGISKYYYENGALKQVLSYDNGLLTKKIDVPFDPAYSAPIESYLAGNRQYKLSKEANIVSDVEISPVPVNGYMEIKNNLIYPKESLEKGIEGVVTLSVGIDTTGKSTDFVIIKSLNKECDASAISSIEKTKFLPGKNDTKVVNSKIIINIEFKPAEKSVARMENIQKIRKDIEEIIKPIEINNEADTKIVEPVKQIVKNELKTNERKPEQVKKESNKEEITTEEAKIVRMGAKNEILTDSEADPKPVGGIERILARLHIPGKAIELKIEGEMIVKVEVDKYGVVRDTKIIKGLGYGIDEAIEIAILDSPFKAGKINGETVRATTVLIIPFTYKKL